MSKPAILIVDDEPDLLDILKFALEGEGFRTITAARVGEALAVLRRTQVDLVLTDVRMPEGDGLQILVEAKRLNPQTAVILMTGFADVGPTEAVAQGAAKLLLKPFEHSQLIATVRSLLGGR